MEDELEGMLRDSFNLLICYALEKDVNAVKISKRATIKYEERILVIEAENKWAKIKATRKRSYLMGTLLTQMTCQ